MSRTAFRSLAAALILSTTLAAPATLITPAAQAKDLPASFADLVEKLSPAVVNVSTTQKVKGGTGAQMFGELPDDPQFDQFRDFFERFGQMQGGKGGKEAPEHEVNSLGSGFVIDPTGYIITNNHVIDQAEEVTVTFADNVKHKAKIIGRDKKTDLALLKIDAPKPLPFVPLGDSDKMRVGDWVIAIGNPYGLGGSVTQGIISARQRSINAGPFDDFLQTDAPINRGNSGGPLFSVNGEVIGINTAIFSPSGGSVGIGFAIPTSLAKPVIEQLKQYGRTHRAWLGVKIQEVSDEMAESMALPKSSGAFVVELSDKSPAAKAGVLAGDIITHFDGKEISEMRFLPRMVADTKIGKTVELTVWRKGKSLTLKATLEEMDESDDEAKTEEKAGAAKPKTVGAQTLLGMELVPLTKALRDENKLDAKVEGLLITDIDPASEAAKRGVQPGDLVLEVNNEAVKAPAEFKLKLDAAKKAGRKFVLLKVQTEKDAAFVTLPVEEKKK